MLTIFLSLALALTPHGGTHAAQAAGSLPTRGLFIPGVSLAGVRIGDTQRRVVGILGPKYKTCSYCADPTFLWMYRTGEPLGMAARFQKGHVVAVFTLGSPAGWKTDKGLAMGDGISSVYQFFSNTGTKRCIGFDAITAQTGKVTTAFYSAAGVVYGFALVIPGMTVCQ
jgi:hypothetical protein